MAEEKKEEKKEVTETESAKAESKASKKEVVIETIAAIFLGITALLTAWAGWIGSLHGGNQATNYAKSNNLSAEANSEWNEASQYMNQDMTLWNEYYKLKIQADFAEEAGDYDNADMYNYEKDVLLDNNVSDEFYEAIEWALAEEESTGYLVSPFDKEGYVDSYYEDARDLLAESDEILAQGQRDNTCGDKFNLVVVIYSIVLFLLGIIGIFKSLPNRTIVLIGALICFVVATAYMFTIPMPTGFSLSSFFGA